MMRFFKSRVLVSASFVWAAIIALSPLGSTRAGAEPITIESLLREMLDRDAIARFPDPPYTCKQFSSYDRASVSPDNRETWFANNDFSQFLRTDEIADRKEWVMADMEGPGAVVRIWSANPKGTLRVYLDHDSVPVIEAPMQDVLGGQWKVGKMVVEPPLAEENSRGWNLYLPIPYAKHCKITSDQQGFYYQVNYRTYSGGQVRTFAAADLPDLSTLSFDVVEPEPSTKRPWAAPQIMNNEIAPGQASAIVNSTLGREGSVIRSLAVKLSGQDPAEVLRTTILTAEFDGHRTIWCPVGDLFGSGVGLNPLRDAYRTVEASGWLRCFFVMPFRGSVKLELLNLSDQPIVYSSRVLIDNASNWDDRSMYFHAVWRHQYPIHALGGRGTEDWNYVEIQGEGVYVGDNLAVMNPVPEWWGEGDEKIYIDGETFPSHFGTGTEDYYGYAWCSPVPFQHPFHAQPRCDGNPKSNWGHTTVTRMRSLDAIPFTKSLKFDMEVWHWRECDVAYAATTYWYAKPGATSNRLTDEAIEAMTVEIKKPIPQAPPLPPPFKIAEVIECESMKVIDNSEGLNAVAQDMAGFAAKTWSGDAHLWVQARRPGDFVKLEIPAPAVPGVEDQWLAYRVTLYATKSWDYGIIRFLVNGQPAKTVDLYSGQHGQALATGPIDLGTFKPIDGRLTLRAEVFGANPASEGGKSFFGLDGVRLEPVSQAPRN